MKRVGLELVPICDAGFAGGSLASCAMTDPTITNFMGKIARPSYNLHVITFNIDENIQLKVIKLSN